MVEWWKAHSPEMRSRRSGGKGRREKSFDATVYIYIIFDIVLLLLLLLLLKILRDKERERERGSIMELK